MFAYRSKNLDRGFTLMELLVVVGIIALLSTVVLSTLDSARKSSRNSVRVQEIDAYTKSGQLFQVNNKRFPQPSGALTTYYCLGRAAAATCWGGANTGNDQLNTEFQTNLAKPPGGANNGLAQSGYLYLCISTTGCTAYTILFMLEGTGQSCGGNSLTVDPALSGAYTYCQAMQCPAGKAPVRSGGSTSTFICS